MSNLLLSLAAILLLSLPSFGQADTQKTTQPLAAPIPLDAAKKENPVKYTSESIARGRRQYGIDCAMCHGKEGDGKGDVAVDMKLKVGNFTEPNALKDRTDGELFYLIKNGRGDMPPEGDRVKPDLVWDMVNYIRSFSKKRPLEEKPATDEKPGDKSPS